MLGPQDIQYLEELAEMYRLGHLSDAAFKHATNLVMTKHAKSISPTSNAVRSRPPIASKAPRATTTATKPRLTAIREPAVYPSSTTTTSTRHKAQKPRSTAAIRAEQEAEPHNIFSMKSKSNSQDSSIVSTIVVVLFASAIALATSESTPFTRLFQPTDTAEAALPTPTALSSPEIRFKTDALFGPDAVVECREQCAIAGPKNLAVCNRACQRLSLAEYGRRVTLKELDAGRDATMVLERCSNLPLSSRRQTQSEWADSVSKTLGMLQNTTTSLGQTTFGGARLTYASFSEARKNLTLPGNRNAENSSLVKQLAVASCLHAHLALAEQGAIIAGENADSFSRRFYYRLHQSLANKVEPMRVRLKRTNPTVAELRR